MSSTTTKSFLFVDCNPLDGIQKPKKGESKLKRSHVVREASRQARAKRLVALTIPNVSTGTSKVSSSETRTQSTAAQLVDKQHFPKSTALTNAHVNNDEGPANAIMLRKNKLLGPLGACELDPLHVYPPGSDLSLYVDGLVDYALAFTWPSLFPSASSGAADPVGSKWLHCAIKSPVAFYALMFGAGDHEVFHRNGPSTTKSAALLRLSYKTQAIKLINEQLKKSGRDSTDALLISISVLAVYGSERHASNDHVHPQSPLAKAQDLDFYGKKKFVHAHMQALYLVVEQTGGLDSIKLYGLADTLALADIVASTLDLTAPRFPLRQSPDSLVTSGKHVMDIEALRLSQSLGQGFNILLQDGLQEHLVKVLYSMSELTVALDHNQRGGGHAPQLSDIVSVRTATQHQLLSLAPPSSELPVSDECIYNVIRVATLIYSDMVLFPLPPASTLKPRLADMLRRALDCCTLQSCWDLYPNLMLWAVVLGGIAASSISYRYWYASRLYNLSTELGLHRWEAAKEALSSFLWWDPVCDKPAKKLWYESHQTHECDVD